MKTEIDNFWAEYNDSSSLVTPPRFVPHAGSPSVVEPADEAQRPGGVAADSGSAEYSDPVSHPSHYTRGGIECISAIRAATTGLSGFEGYLVGNAIKYIWRFKHKGKPAQDLEKAMWYLRELLGEQE